MKKPLLLIIFILSILASNANNFSRITVSDGLTDKAVTQMMLDSRGYMWITTFNGLSRYNGTHFHNYLNTTHSTFFNSNRIRCIEEDINGNMWIGTEDGITIYNHRDNHFNTITPKHDANSWSKSYIIKRIMKAGKNMICISENNQIYIYNISGKLLKRICNTERFFNNAYYIDSHILAMSTVANVYFFDTVNFQVRKESIGNIGDINSVSLLSNNQIAVCTNNGLLIYDFHTKNNDVIINNKSSLLLKGNNLKCVSQDKSGGIWIGTNSDGIGYYKNFSELMKSPNEMNFISPKVKMSGFLLNCFNYNWAYSFSSGILKYNIQKKFFHKIALSDIVTEHAIPFDSERVLVHNSPSKLYCYNIKTKSKENIPYTNKLSIDNVRTLLVDSKKNIWLLLIDNESTHLKLLSSSLTKEVSLPYKIGNERILPRDFFEDYDGNLWLSYNNHIVRVEFDDAMNIKNIESLKDNKQLAKINLAKLRCLYSDKKSQTIWLGTNVQGLYRITLKNNSLKDAVIENYHHNIHDKNSLQGDMVSSICKISENELLIGCESGGISVVNPNKKRLTFHDFSQKRGMKSDVCYSILNENNNLWVATSAGLEYYDSKKDIFYLYDKNDGLPVESFRSYSYKMDNGNMLFLGYENAFYFKPSNLSRKESIPRFYFGDLILNNKNMGAVNSNKLDLDYDDKVFSINVESLHYSDPKKYLIKYNLSPLNSSWVTQYADQPITFIGLPSGQYKLQVMASNSFGEWSVPKTMYINIKPPFWETVWAYIIYFVLICGIAYVIIRSLWKFKILQYKLAIKEKEKQRIKIVNDEKLKFFSNIAHELKTPLTLINVTVNDLSKIFLRNKEIFIKLEMIERQAKKMLQLVDYAHGIQLKDANLLKMNKTVFSFNKFIDEIVSDFRIMSDYHNKNLNETHLNDDVNVFADKSMIEKVFNNLLNNAFKHTRENDSIDVVCTRDENNIIVKVIDTGYGIMQEDLPHIFERFFQAKNKGDANIGGTGIGLSFSKVLIEMHNGKITVESEWTKGTTFTLSLPIVTDKEIDNIEEENKNEFGAESSIVSSLDTDFEIDSETKESMVYIVEDNSDMRNLLKDLISKYYLVKVFENGIGCLESMQDEWPEIVISDVMMPEMDGYALCKTIKSDIKTSHIPVVLLTACNETKDKIKGVEYGADSYISKPFDAQFLLTTINMLLKNRIQLRNRFQIGIPITYGNKSANTFKDNKFLEKLYEILDKNVNNEEFDINAITKELGINRTLFFKKIKVLTNTTPSELFKEYRLKKASELFLTKDLSVNEVYIMTGFKNRSHFSRVFKEKYGCSPREYIDKNKKTQ